jgi:Fe2+ transport system protein FeoA
MPTETLLPLELLQTGEWADVATICGETAEVNRLAEIGLRTGCRLCVLQGGSPCLLEVEGVRLCLRGVTDILVKPLGQSRGPRATPPV